MKRFLLAIGLVASTLFSGFASNQGRTCGTMDALAAQMAADPGLSQRMQDIENQTVAYAAQQSSKNANRTNMVVVIPVVFHVVYNTTAQNVSDAQILAQLNQLNLDYAKQNTDASLIPAAFATVAANTQIQFCMAQRTPTGTATNGIERRQTTTTAFSSNGNNMKYYANGGLDAWNSSQYLNIWVCNMSGGILGFAQFPGGTAATDGVVLQYSTVGSMASPFSGGAPYNLGRTATHEVGHWLNLIHIWGDANCGNDQVSDTPLHNTSNYGCPTYPTTSTCTGSPVMMTMNYMDYTDDACMYMFTAGQSTRMNALFASGGARVSLLSSLGCTAPNTCGAPTNATATNISSTGATLSWTPSTSASSYNVQYCVTGTTTCTSTTTTGSSLVLSGLSPATSYTFNITSNCSAGTSSTVSGTFTTFSAACGVPTGLVATPSTTSAAATLSWTGVSGAASYTVQYKTSVSTSWTTIGSTGTSVTVSNLASSATYNWQVSANCIGISSAYVAGPNFTTIAVSCGTASSLSAGSITAGSAALTWTAVTGASSYNVQYKTSTATTWTTVTSTTNSRTITSLSANTTYNWQVSTVCSNGASSSYVAGPNFTTLSACTDNYESNNTQSAAKTIPQNSTINGLISSSTDRDWFKFTTVSPNTNIKVTLSNLPKDYDLKLYSSTGTTLTTSQNGGTTSETIIRNTTVATSYFLQVYPYSTTDFSSTLCYNLLVNTGSTTYRIGVDGSVSEINNEVDLNDFTMYPNPTSQTVNITYNALESGSASIRLFDMVGKVMIDQPMQFQGGYNKFTFDVSDFSKGIYFVEVIRNGERTVKKLVVEH